MTTSFSGLRTALAHVYCLRVLLYCTFVYVQVPRAAVSTGFEPCCPAHHVTVYLLLDVWKFF